MHPGNIFSEMQKNFALRLTWLPLNKRATSFFGDRYFPTLICTAILERCPFLEIHYFATLTLNDSVLLKLSEKGHFLKN